MSILWLGIFIPLNLFRSFFYIWNEVIRTDMITKDKRNEKYHAIKKRSMTMKLNSASNWQHTIAKFWLVSNCINLYLIWDEFMPCKLIVQALVVTLLSFNALSSEASGFLFNVCIIQWVLEFNLWYLIITAVNSVRMA